MVNDMQSKYMMGTTAIHGTGDISRSTPNLCVVYKEDGDNYVGNWVEGFGFIDVKFPKATTRELTAEEVEKWHGVHMMIGSSYAGALNLKNENFQKRVRVTKKGDTLVREGVLAGPVKVNGIISMFQDDGQTFRTSTIKEIKGIEVQTLNSIYQLEYL
jgi:hypothetical protein